MPWRVADLDPGPPCVVCSVPTHARPVPQIHKGILKQFKYALVWGLSAKHRGHKVGKDHELEDEDIVQIVKKI